MSSKDAGRPRLTLQHGADENEMKRNEMNKMSAEWWNEICIRRKRENPEKIYPDSVSTPSPFHPPRNSHAATETQTRMPAVALTSQNRQFIREMPNPVKKKH